MSMIRDIQRFAIALAALILLLPTAAFADPLVFVAAGPNATSIQSTVENFRNQLGALNPNVAGSFGSGRREINWDGVPDNFAAPNNLPANFFNVNSPRGVVFSTPGTGFQVSADTTPAVPGTPVEFGNINSTYPSTFGIFSPQRLFVALGSTITDVNFFIPGSTTPALVSGFGAVFTDVDLANSTSIEFYGAANNLLYSQFVPASPGSETLSFLGVSFDSATISRVRITSGNTALGPNDGGSVDVVAMDDFIYSEPVQPIPEPATMLLLGTGLAGVAGAVRRRRKTSNGKED